MIFDQRAAVNQDDSQGVKIWLVILLAVLVLLIGPALMPDETPLPAATNQSCAGWTYWLPGGTIHSDFDCVSGGHIRLDVDIPPPSLGEAWGEADTDYGVEQARAIVDAGNGVTSVYATGESRSSDSLDPPGGSSDLLEDFACVTVSGHTSQVAEEGVVQVSVYFTINNQHLALESFWIEGNQTISEQFCGTFQYRETQSLEIEHELIVESFVPKGNAYAGQSYVGSAAGNFMGTMVLSVLDVDPYYLEHSESGTTYPIVRLPFIDHFELGNLVAWPAVVE